MVPPGCPRANANNCQTSTPLEFTVFCSASSDSIKRPQDYCGVCSPKLSLAVIFDSAFALSCGRCFLSLETDMDGGKMQSPFELWIGRAVIVQLTLGQVKLSLRGTLLKDGSEILLVKPEAGSHLEIPKTKVLAIEEVRHCCTACHAFSPSRMRRVRHPARFTNRRPS